MENNTLYTCKQKILSWDLQNYHALARSMTPQEQAAMLDTLRFYHYPLSKASPEPEDILYDYILLLAYLYENSETITQETKWIYKVLYSIHQ